MNSHIQLPKSVLNQFKSQDGKVWYLDLVQSKIGLSPAKNIGVENDYYSETAEAVLSRIVETPLGMLRSTISNEIENDVDYITLLNDSEGTFKNYIIASIARSKMMLDAFRKQSITAVAASEQENHDDPVLLSLREGSSLREKYKAWGMGVLVNETSLGFVVPRNCFFIAGIFKNPHFITPLTPKIALALIDPNSHPESKKYIHTATYIDDEAIIKQLNENALHQEYITNKCFVAGNDCAELERLKQILEANRNTYEQEWEELQRI